MMNVSLNSLKKNVILGLIFCAIMLFPLVFLDNLLAYLSYNFYFIGLTIYFAIVLMRMKKININIKIANNFLLATCIVTIITSVIYGIIAGEGVLSLNHLTLIVMILYFCNLFYKKPKLINNKMFSFVVIGVSIYFIIVYIIDLIKYYDLLNMSYIFNYLKFFAQIAIVPYFYNYYNLLKEKENGK